MEKSMNELGLLAPWETRKKQITALFGEDPDISIKEEGDTLKLYVNNSEKAEALTVLLPEEYTFGNKVLRVEVIPGNKDEGVVETFAKAFAGNPVFSYASTTINSPYGGYVVFRHRLCQFFNDDLADVNGNCTTTFAEVAGEVFGDQCGAVSFCTDTPENLGKPLGEWP